MNHVLLILILSPLAAFGWSQKVTETGGIFHFVRRFKLPSFLRKPLYECTACVAGQMALWYEVFSNFTFTWGEVDITDHLLYGFASILTILACIGLAMILQIKSMK